MKNFDEDLLISLRVDPEYNEPILNQVLRIAIYDEFHAYETYKKVIEQFGASMPFSNIIQAEERHFNALLNLLQKYGVEVPINDWASKIELPKTLVECCEVGVAAEIDNIMMYDNLLSYTQQEDVKDVLYRLQAASYNNHLPAFRKCVAKQNTDVNVSDIYNNYSTHKNEDVFSKLQEFQGVVSSIMSGKIDPNQITKLVNNLNGSLVGGLAIGALGAAILSQMKNKE